MPKDNQPLFDLDNPATFLLLLSDWFNKTELAEVSQDTRSRYYASFSKTEALRSETRTYVLPGHLVESQ